MKYTKEVLEEAVKNSTSVSDVLRSLGIKKVNGGNHTYIASRIEHFDIDISHFLGQGWTKGQKTGGLNKKAAKDILVLREGGSHRESAKILRRAMAEVGVIYCCSNCSIKEWDGKEIRLEVDHINGDGLDNRIENLRFLCPNCHSQTETFRNYNKKKTYVRNKRKKCTNCEDGTYTRSKTGLCRKCSSKARGLKNRKVDRPSQEQIEKDVEKLGYTGTGKKYGVSYKAIQSWIK